MPKDTTDSCVFSTWPERAEHSFHYHYHIRFNSTPPQSSTSMMPSRPPCQHRPITPPRRTTHSCSPWTIWFNVGAASNARVRSCLQWFNRSNENHIRIRANQILRGGSPILSSTPFSRPDLPPYPSSVHLPMCPYLSAPKYHWNMTYTYVSSCSAKSIAPPLQLPFPRLTLIWSIQTIYWSDPTEETQSLWISFNQAPGIVYWREGGVISGCFAQFIVFPLPLPSPRLPLLLSILTIYWSDRVEYR